jgi:hypothetical protein
VYFVVKAANLATRKSSMARIRMLAVRQVSFSGLRNKTSPLGTYL